MRNTVLVGEAPSRQHGAFAGPWFDRVARMAGLADAEALRGRVEHVNLFSEPRPRQGRGSSFDPKAARRLALELAPRLAGKRVVFLGRRVSGAFGVLRVTPSLTWFAKAVEGVELTVAVLPHPSGVDRWWNSRMNRLRAVDFLRAALAEEAQP